MKILEKEFRKKGFFHKQIWREGQYAIYERKRVTIDANKPHYELIIIKEHPAYEMAGVCFEAGEGYPSDNQFGVLAWNLQTKEAAFEKLKIVQQHQKELAALPEGNKRGRKKK